jgi:hypothetical protein
MTDKKFSAVAPMGMRLRRTSFGSERNAATTRGSAKPGIDESTAARVS